MRKKLLIAAYILFWLAAVASILGFYQSPSDHTVPEEVMIGGQFK